MAIILDNSTDTIDFGDAGLKRKGTNALETGDLDVTSLRVTDTGITFPDNSVQTSAASGSSSGPVITELFNNTYRYAMVSTTGQQVWATSCSTIFLHKTWTRSGTVLTINHVAHGRSVGDRVLIRKTNVDYQNCLIDAVTTDDFSVTCADTGDTEGTLGAYSLGFTYAHNSSTPGSIANGTMSAPADGDVRLLSLRMMLAANQRSATNYIINFPASAINGIGQNSELGDSYIPIQSVRQLVNAMTAVAATLTTYHNSSYASYQIAALPVVATGIFVTLNF